MNKASGGDGIPIELFQILKDDAEKVLHSICQQIWKIQQWPQTWKRLIFIPIPKKGNAKEWTYLHGGINKLLLVKRWKLYFHDVRIINYTLIQAMYLVQNNNELCRL